MIFSRSSLRPQRRQLPRRSSTAWLDGCRGYAAAIVVVFHFLIVYVPSIRFGYGMQLPKGHLVFDNFYVPYGAEFVPATNVSPDRWRVTNPSQIISTHWYQLPIIRVLIAGDSMVSVFFVVSGYNLSIKPLNLIRKSARADLCSSLASSIWRRPIRLFGPTVISTLLVAIMAGAGLFNAPYHALGYDAGLNVVAERRKYFKGPNWEEPPPWAPNMCEHVLHWLRNMYDFLSPLIRNHEFMTMYDWHVWTIPVEYRASLVLYMTHAVFATVKHRYRTLLLGVLLFAAITIGDVWEHVLFWGGMFLCNLDMDKAKKALQAQQAPAWRKYVLHLILLMSLLLMSYPEVEGEFVPWCAWMTKIYLWQANYHDRFHMIQGAGALLFIYVVPRLPYLKAFFSNAFARYLGRISYSIYLIHGPVFRSLGYTIFLYHLGGKDFTPSQYYTAAVTSMVISLPVTVCAAHIFCLLVDEPLVRFARWTESFVFVGTESHQEKQEIKDEFSERGKEGLSLLPLHDNLADRGREQ